MKKSSIIISTILVLMIFAVVLAVGSIPARAEDGEGTITVYNYTDRDLYIVISGRNQGNVSAGYSDTFTAKYGSHRVTAHHNDGQIYKYVNVSKTYPNATWTINQNDI